MELTLNNYQGFEELSENESLNVDGGISWNDVGLAVAGVCGGYLGGQIGAAAGAAIAGPVGVVPGKVVGTVIGTAAGVAIYSAFDK